MKILDSGKNWFRLDGMDIRLRRLQQLLPEVEAWVGSKDPRILTAQYWGITKGSPEETCLVNLYDGYDGEELLVTYEDVMGQFPELFELFKELELQPYLGTNKIGNWGIHRHCYNPTSRWNLVWVGTDGGHGEFYKCNGNHPVEPEYDLVYGILNECEKVEKVETVYLNKDEWYSIDTWQWHAHRVYGDDWQQARAWLMHFKYAPTKEAAQEVFKHLNDWGVKRLLWRWSMEHKYRYGTHKL